jgi:hypothetical protein
MSSISMRKHSLDTINNEENFSLQIQIYDTGIGIKEED